MLTPETRRDVSQSLPSKYLPAPVSKWVWCVPGSNEGAIILYNKLKNSYSHYSSPNSSLMMVPHLGQSACLLFYFPSGPECGILFPKINLNLILLSAAWHTMSCFPALFSPYLNSDCHMTLWEICFLNPRRYPNWEKLLDLFKVIHRDLCLL